MSVFQIIGRVAGQVAGVISLVVGIGKQMLPFIRAAREVSPDVDRVVDRIEAEISAGGTAADDWLDNNIAALRALDGFFLELGGVAVAGRDVTAAAIAASQSETPDTLTPAEAETLIAKIAILRAALAALGTKNDLEKLLAAL